MSFFRKLISYLKTKIGILNESLLRFILNRTRRIKHRGIGMLFYTPNFLTKYRIESFSTKEPETLAWIDSFEKKSIFWDIGANIGIYSIYAAKKDVNVFSFEPSVFNLELLAKNISINSLDSNVSIIPIALSNKTEINSFQLTNISWGGALSTFGKDFDQYGEKIQTCFKYKYLGISGDDIVKVFNMPLPNYIKIDVDGIEHLILNGLLNTLDSVSEILIEINEDFEEQKTTTEKILSNLGFIFIDKFYLGSERHFNQLWRKG